MTLNNVFIAKTYHVTETHLCMQVPQIAHTSIMCCM